MYNFVSSVSVILWFCIVFNVCCFRFSIKTDGLVLGSWRLIFCKATDYSNSKCTVFFSFCQFRIRFCLTTIYKYFAEQILNWFTDIEYRFFFCLFVCFFFVFFLFVFFFLPVPDMVCLFSWRFTGNIVLLVFLTIYRKYLSEQNLNCFLLI